MDGISYAQAILTIFGSLLSSGLTVAVAIWMSAAERTQVRADIKAIQERLAGGDVRMDKMEQGQYELRNGQHQENVEQARISERLETIRTDIDWIKHWLRDDSKHGTA